MQLSEQLAMAIVTQTPAGAASGDYGYVTGNIRTCPNTSWNCPVTVTGYNGWARVYCWKDAGYVNGSPRWFYVRTTNYSGWAHSRSFRHNPPYRLADLARQQQRLYTPTRGARGLAFTSGPRPVAKPHICSKAGQTRLARTGDQQRCRREVSAHSVQLLQLIANQGSGRSSVAIAAVTWSNGDQSTWSRR